MKIAVIVIFAALVALSVVAWVIEPLDNSRNTSIVWVTDDNPARRGQIDLFNRLHRDTELRLDPANTGVEKIVVQCLAGVGPDLFDCTDPSALATFVRSGIAWDVTNDLQRAGVAPLRDQWSVVHPLVRYRGRVYGCGTNASANGIWFNKDAFDRAGLPYPEGEWTWEEFLPIAKRLTVRDARGRIRQFGFSIDWSAMWQQFIWQWGGRVYSEDGTRCVLGSPQAVEAVQFMQDLVYKYRIAPTPAEESGTSQGGWGAGYINQFGAGRAAMAVGGRWWLCSLRNFGDLRLGAVECPRGRHRVFYGYSRATLINRDSPRREQALKFLVYMSGMPYNNLINEQADGLAPVISSCCTPEFLHNPKYPSEDFNSVWRGIMGHSRPAEISPFIDYQVANRIFAKQLDLIKANQKTASQGMRAAEKAINEQIRKNIHRDPILRAQYEALTRRQSK